MSRKNRSAEEQARRAKIRELLQESNISSMEDIQNLFKETIAEFMENGLDAELDEELGYSRYDYKSKNTDNSRNGHSGVFFGTGAGFHTSQKQSSSTAATISCIYSNIKLLNASITDDIIKTVKRITIKLRRSMMTNINIGNKIRELRKRKGITQEALATALSVSPQAVSKWESALTYPDMTLIPVIAGYFEVSLDVLFDYDVTQMKAGVQKIINDAREYFFAEPLRFAETIKSALQDYPGNEDLLMALIDAHEYDMRENGSTEHLDEIIELSQRLITESGDFVRICSAKEFLAIAYLKKNDYEKAKQILETLPVSVELKNDSIAMHLKGKDKLNGAILSGCDHLFGLYSACYLEGDAWFRMDEQDVSFKDYTQDDYIHEALKVYLKGVKVLETFLIDEYDGQDQYLWDGMQTFHWSFYCRIAACYKKLGRIDECEKAVNKAYEIISSAWSDFDENQDYYTPYFYESFREHGLEEYIR